MIFSEVTLSYPCVRHKVEVSHFTARKSTAIEWVVLESINKCEALSNYAGISIAAFFKEIFTISDADLLIRPCLISLQDMGAITFDDIDDETELDKVPMNNLKLTKKGKEMQIQGLLPGSTAEDAFYIYYDIVATALREDSSLYKEDSTGIRVIDADDAEKTEFPIAAIREWLTTVQQEKKRKQLTWLAPTTRIQDINSIKSTVLWKNTSKKVEIVEGMRWKLVGSEDERIDEVSLDAADISCPEELRNIPLLNLINPDQEIKRFVSITDIKLLIGEYLQKDDLFCVEEKFYKDFKLNQQNKKKLRIGIIYGADVFSVDSKGKQVIIRIPDYDMREHGVYFNVKDVVQAGRVTVKAGSISKDIAIAYVPKLNQISLVNEVVAIVDKYYEKDSSILFALYELGLKDLFFEYADKIILKEESISAKAEIIDSINSKSFGYYNQKMISATDKERLLINDNYIFDQCKSVEGAISVINQYAAINSFRQDESLFKRIITIVVENVGLQDSLEAVWRIWETVLSVKKSYISCIGMSGLHKNIYSKKSILELLDRFKDENIFEIKEYTPVERIILNMRRIVLRMEEKLPELDLYRQSSEEKYNEIILHHIEDLTDLYDLVRQWNDEEDRFNNSILKLDEVLDSNTQLLNIKKNIDGLRNTLATFFDDSFMRYNKVYIVDTCTLMNEPGLISWFNGEKALLVIPMVVLDELDGLKSSDDEEKANSAREVIRMISNYKAYEWLNISESSHPELLSDDLDKDRNDNKILSIAIRYSAKRPILLTDDINLGNIATANKIESMTSESYLAKKKNEKLTSKGNSKKQKKKKW